MGWTKLRLVVYLFGSLQNRACCIFEIKYLRLNIIKNSGFDHILVCKSMKNTLAGKGFVLTNLNNATRKYSHGRYFFKIRFR